MMNQKPNREQVTREEILEIFKEQFEEPVPCAVTWATKARLTRWMKKYGKEAA